MPSGNLKLQIIYISIVYRLYITLTVVVGEPAKPSTTCQSSPQTGDVCKAWNVVFYRVVVIVDTPRRVPILMKYGRELAPSGGLDGACQGTNASPQGNNEAARFGCNARRGCTGTGAGTGAGTISCFREDDLNAIFMNSAVLHMGIEI